MECGLKRAHGGEQTVLNRSRRPWDGRIVWGPSYMTCLFLNLGGFAHTAGSVGLVMFITSELKSPLFRSGEITRRIR